MRQLALSLVLLAAPFAARAGEGVFFTVDGGYAVWGKDDFRKRLLPQVGRDPVSGLTNTELLLDRQLPDGALLGVHLGYNIAGHVAFEGSLMLHPWDPLSDTRGFAGLAGFAVRWFPMQGLLRPNRQYDISLIAGMDYAITGSNGIKADAPNPAVRLENTGRGFDGVAVELGTTIEVYPVRWLSIGVTPRVYLVDPMRYFVNFDKRDQGGAIPLSGKGGVSLYSISASVSFHFEPLPD